MLLSILWPVLIVIAMLVRWDSPGPVLFRQVRLGLAQKPFVMLKIRTMRSGADQTPHREHVLALLRSDDPSGLAAGLYKMAQDPRVTRAGDLLRRTSLDELPQLVNVLRGEMSLVGPRPALAYELEGYEPHHFRRFEVKPGLTGLWQVSGRSRLSPRQALELDVLYVDSRRLDRDLRILAVTPWRTVLRGSAR